jgi:hypothetical protein
MAGPEFIFLNDQAVRVTSLRRDDTTQAFTFVFIARGSGDRDRMTELFEAQPLTLRIPDEGEWLVAARDVDLRSSGEGQQAFHRFSVTLVPAGDPAPETQATPEPTIDDRLTSLEQRMDQIVALLNDIKAGRS